LQRFPLFAYAGSISLITAIFLSSESLFLAASGIDASWIVILGLLFIWPASELGVGISNLIFTSVLPPKLLPKLELAQGIPAGFRTIVVVPSMLTHAAEVTALLDRLEMHYLAGPDPNLRFALLTDFSDAPQQDMPSDSALLQQATKGVEALNHKYQVPGYAPFYLFHRRRLWNSREGVWMGWERKRGKLLEFHQLLQGSLTEVDPMRWTNFTLG